MTRYLSIKSVCAIFEISKVTFHRWQKDPKKPTLHPVKKLRPMVRFAQEDVDAYVIAIGGANGGVELPSNNNSEPLQEVA